MTGAEQVRPLADDLRSLAACVSQPTPGYQDLARRAADALSAAEAELRDAREEIAAYRASLSAHHNIANLSREAIDESIGGPCQVCARAQDERRAVLARAGEPS